VINVALEALSGQGCELPAYSTLDRLAAALRTEVNGGVHRLVSGRLDAAGRARLLELLVVDPLSRQSALPRLTRPVPRATVSRLREHIAWLAWLDALGPTEMWLAGIPPAKVAHFAGEAAVLDANELSGVSEDKRLTLLACLVHTARIRARDEVVTMFCRGSAQIRREPAIGVLCLVRASAGHGAWGPVVSGGWITCARPRRRLPPTNTTSMTQRTL
jgi:hypothetical protein